MQTLVDGGNYTIDTALAASGVQVLQLYDWSKRHRKVAGTSALKPYVDEIAVKIEKTINHRPKKGDQGAPPEPAFMAPRRIAIPDSVDDIAELPPARKHVRECGIQLGGCDIPLAACGNRGQDEMRRLLESGGERFASAAARLECGD